MDFWTLARKRLSSALSSFAASVYPPLCLVCQKRLELLPRLFCDACQQEWPWVERPPCEPLSIDSSATCEPIGAPLALARAFQSGHLFLVETLASLMVLQWERLRWPLPDRVVPLIEARYFSKKKRETRLLADQVAQWLLNREASSLDTLCARETILFISLYGDRKAFEEQVRSLAGGFHRQVLSLSFL